MKQIVASLVAGLLFGAGLGISGMTLPDKVIAFLDLSEGWDPSLMWVMFSAVAVHLVLFRLILRRPAPLFAGRFWIPTRTEVDGRLIGGAALFGVGWGLGGYCPGPGLVAGGSGGSAALIFLAALTGGMLLYHVMDEAYSGWRAARRQRQPSEQPVPLQAPI